MKKRIIFWLIFVVVLGLIIWGVVASLERQASQSANGVGPLPPVTAADHILYFGPGAGPLGSAVPIMATSSAAVGAKPVVLVEYGDFQCPACEAYYPVVAHVLASTTVPVEFVFRHFPLPQHPNAKPAAYASEAAALQGKFWPMFNLLYANHFQWTELGDPTPVFDGYAESIGLNKAAFDADMKSPAVTGAIDADIASDNSLGLFQTPTFFLNGTMIQNPQSYDEFNADIQAAAR